MRNLIRLPPLVVALAAAVPAPGGGLLQEPDPGSGEPAAASPLGGKAEASYIATSGNTDTQALGVAGKLEYASEPWEASFEISFFRSRNEGVENARSFETSLRGARSLSAHAQAYARVAYLRDRFAGLEGRLSSEAGVALRLLQRGGHTLRLDAGVGAVSEDRVSSPDLDFLSGRGLLTYRWKLSETAELVEAFSWTQNLEDGGDWRLLNEASLNATLTSLLAVKIAHRLETRNEPPAGFGRTDTRTSAALVASF